MRNAESDANVIGLGKAGVVPGIVGEPAGGQRENSVKEKQSRPWESEVMVMPPLYFFFFFWPHHVACRILVP